MDECSSCLKDCRGFAEHAKNQHGYSIKMTPRSAGEQASWQRLRYQEARGKTERRCTYSGCVGVFFCPQSVKKPRCKAHPKYSREDVLVRSVYGLGRAAEAQCAQGTARIVRLMYSTETKQKRDPEQATRCLAVVAPATKGSYLAIYDGEIGKPEKGPMTRMVSTRLKKFQGLAIMGRMDPTPGCHLGQYCNSPTQGKNSVNAEQVWRDEWFEEGGLKASRPVCYVRAIGNHFENASEDNPVEILVAYGDWAINWYEGADYDQTCGHEFWDEERRHVVPARQPSKRRRR
jgi:hypothetical protein